MLINNIIKRFLDIFFALAGIVLLWPLFAIITIWIKIDSHGTVFYRGLRIGRDYKPFFQIKFRTMISDAELVGGSRTSKQDFRITPSGYFIRKYKLDELPQLFNIMIGEMSIVGPRPDVKEYVNLYSDSEKCIMSLRPGLTDWATLWYRDEGEALADFAEPEVAYKQYFHPTKVKLQLDYFYNHSTFVDIYIIISTFIAIFRKNWSPRMLADRLVKIGEARMVATSKGNIV